MTRRPARSRMLEAMRDAGYGVTDLPGERQRADREPAARADQCRAARQRQSGAEPRGLRCASLPACPTLSAARSPRAGACRRPTPSSRRAASTLPVRLYGNAAVAIQPARGYNIDPKSHLSRSGPGAAARLSRLLSLAAATPSAPTRSSTTASTAISNGCRARPLALSGDCYPEVALGPLPQLYPFIVNDPGEGTQAKRRTGAVIIDHLTPPLTRAETYGPLKDLEALVDEYYLASGLDRRRRDALQARHPRPHAQQPPRPRRRLHRRRRGRPAAPRRLSLRPQGSADPRWPARLRRIARRAGCETRSARRARPRAARPRRRPRPVPDPRPGIDFGFKEFDPLTCDMATAWTGPRPALLAALSDDPWRSAGDTVERLEGLRAAPPVIAAASCAGRTVPADARRSRSCRRRGPALARRLRPGRDRRAADGPRRPLRRPRPIRRADARAARRAADRAQFLFASTTAPCRRRPPGSSGQKSAEDLLAPPLPGSRRLPASRSALSAWGTSNMRTGGDDIAQALALIGAQPVWEPSSWRVTGFEIIPLAKLGRPRVDVTCASPASSAMPSRRRSNFSTGPSAPSARSTRPTTTTRSPPACAPRRQDSDAAGMPRGRRARTWPATASSARSPAPMAPACRR